MRAILQTPLWPEILQRVQRISQFKEQWAASANISRDFYSSLKKTTIITSAGASTRIEGATLSDEEILKRLTGLKIQHIRDRNEAEVAGYIDCKKYIFDHYRELEITEHCIRSLHQMMMQYLPSNIFPIEQRGAYKNITNAVIRVDHATGRRETIFETTPPGPQTETAMRELVTDYTHHVRDPNYSDLETIAAFILTFLAIHPFRDGNGRVSRLLTDLCLLKQGYSFCMYSSHEKVIEDNKEQYYVALRQTQSSLREQADINPWFLFFLKVLEQQTRHLQDKVAPLKSGTTTKLEQQVLELIQKYQPATIGFLERESGIARVTIKGILARLKVKGTVTMEGSRKGSRYRLRAA